MIINANKNPHETKDSISVFIIDWKRIKWNFVLYFLIQIIFFLQQTCSCVRWNSKQAQTYSYSSFLESMRCFEKNCEVIKFVTLLITQGKIDHFEFSNQLPFPWRRRQQLSREIPLNIHGNASVLSRCWYTFTYRLDTWKKQSRWCTRIGFFFWK